MDGGTQRASDLPDAPGGGDQLDLGDVVMWVAVTALAAASVIHFAFAPAHLDEETSHGGFFLVVGWLQLAVAAGLALRIRPPRAWQAAAVVLSAGVVAVWLVSRTVGVPGSEQEDVGFADLLATGLELVTLAAAAALWLGIPTRRVMTRRVGFGMATLGSLSAVALVSLSVSPSLDGHDHAHGEEAGGHSHGGGHADGHGDMADGGQDFAQVRMEALGGYLPEDQIEEFMTMAREDLATEIRDRSDFLRTLPEDEQQERIDAYTQWAVENTVALSGDAQASGTEGEGMHSHGPTEWQPITDPDDLLALQGQLDEAGQVIERYPTVADAEAAGYHQISPYVPGIATHYINGDFDNSFDPARPEMLLYNGTDPTSPIVGLSYATVGPEPPEGFVGPNDVWHNHPALCMLGGLVIGIDGTPEDLCESVGGNINRGIGNLWMGHLWQVPGWESPWGLFSAENPSINAATSDMWRNRT
jgi:hypothetical protein